MAGQFPSSSERRSFITRISAGVAAFAATMATGAATAQGQSREVSLWKPERHEIDDWFDTLPGKHRMVFDTAKPEGLGEALPYANNFVRTNVTDYKLQNKDVAVVIIVRSRSTPFGYNDAMWEKYGKAIATRAQFMDPKTKMAPTTNLYNATDYGNQLTNRGQTLDALFKMGVQLAVCATATRGFAGAIADAVGGNTDAINAELIANLLPNSRMVPAGIVAVNRAQERGYSFVSA